MRKLLGIVLFLATASAAQAEPASPVGLFSVHADPAFPVAAVQTNFAVEPGKAVRLSIYDSAEAFLKTARAKLEAPINEQGYALLTLDGLEAGVYAFAAYLDENGDGKLNRGGIFGVPKEPLAFSGRAKIKLHKPRFDEAKVDVAPGSVIVITLKD